jgi:hypothetical protein
MVQNLSRLACFGLTYKHLLNMNTDGRMLASDATVVTAAAAEAASGEDKYDGEERIAMRT